MKRVLISLGLGFLIIPLAFAALLTWKLFWPGGSYPASLLWVLIWPLPLLRLLCRVTSLEVTGPRVFLFAVVGDYLFLSFLFYLALSVRGWFLQRKVKLAPLPPPPAPFLD